DRGGRVDHLLGRYDVRDLEAHRRLRRTARPRERGSPRSRRVAAPRSRVPDLRRRRWRSSHSYRSRSWSWRGSSRRHGAASQWSATRRIAKPRSHTTPNGRSRARPDTGLALFVSEAASARICTQLNTTGERPTKGALRVRIAADPRT